MLTLTRKPDESLILETSDGIVVITLDSIKGNSVKISIDAPDTIDIWRDEIYEKITAQREMKIENKVD